MNIIIQVLLSFFLLVNSHQSGTNLLEVKVLSDSLVVTKNDTEVPIKLQCRNKGKRNLLLYGILSNVLTNAETERLCNVDRVGGGVGLLIFNNQLLPEYTIESIPDSIDYKQIDRDSFKKQMDKAKRQFLAGTRTVEAASVLDLTIKVNIRQFKLKPGKYYLQMIYYSGKGLRDNFVVGPEQIEKDMELHNAVVYQGCATSNQIVVTVI
jgi:hypothetical protein